MRRALMISLLAAVALAACDRTPHDTATARRPAPASTAAMGAAPASAAASKQATPPPVLIPTQVATVAEPAGADTNAGRTIAMQGGNGAAACMSCHGANGEGNAQAGIPRLAGLGRLYIQHQLDSYADGTRRQPVMTPMASGLTPQQRADVSAFYSTLGTAAPASAKPAPSNAPVLAVRGDDKRGLQACINCHGVQGVGDAGANPYLAGQNAQYLMNAIGEWKDGSRHNDPSGQMPAIAKTLTDAESRQLASYYAALPPPAPRNAQMAEAASGHAGPVVQSGPVRPTPPMEGTGTQQGSALTGGAQGPAAGGTATNPGQTR